MFSLNNTDRTSKPNSFQFHLLFKIIISHPSQLYLSHCEDRRTRDRSGLPWPLPVSVITPLIKQLQVIVPGRCEHGVLIGKGYLLEVMLKRGALGEFDQIVSLERKFCKTSGIFSFKLSEKEAKLENRLSHILTPLSHVCATMRQVGHPLNYRNLRVPEMWRQSTA